MPTAITPSKTGSVEPLFLDSNGRAIFAIHHRPDPGVPAAGQVLVALPFNEEMNRCRSMITLQARALARIGVGTLVVDPFGTGDSEGEYRDLRWDIWRDNLQTGLDWLAEQPGGPAEGPGKFQGILGIRLGCILAAELAMANSGAGLALLLWQPVLDGKQHFNQFLRIRLAAQMQRSDMTRETTASLREQLAAGQCIEIAGYEIHPEFAAAVESRNLAALLPPARTPVFWLEQAAAEAPQLPPAAQKLHDSWIAAGLTPEAAFFNGPAFWQTHERAIADHAVELTTRWTAAHLHRT